MELFEWGEKRFARGIAKAMVRSYNMHREFDKGLSERELVRKTLADRPGIAAKTLFTDTVDEDFWNSTVGSLFEAIYILVRLEYIEYMNGGLENEDPKTNLIFKNTILEELGKQNESVVSHA